MLISAIHQHESAVSIHMSPPSHLPFHPIPLGCHRAPDLSSLCRMANFHWLYILHMEMYMFQCYFLNLSHPQLPALCPQICSLYLSLHCCPVNRFISTIFLDSIYVRQYMIFVKQIFNFLVKHLGFLDIK